VNPRIDVCRLRDTLGDCVQQPSPQPDMQAVRRFIVEVVKPRLLDLPSLDLQIDEMGNLIGILPGSDHTSPFLLCTYAGTCPPGNMPEPLNPRIIDGRTVGKPPGEYMWGRGTSEQLGALAAALEAIRVYSEEGLSQRPDIVFATTVAGEMGCHDAVEYMMATGGMAYGPTLLAVGTNNSVCVGNMGRIDVHVEITGKVCHSSDPFKGRNAIEGARQFLNALRDVKLPPPDADLGQPSLTPTFITSTPTSRHTVPDHCMITLDRRLIPGEDTGVALADIERCSAAVHGLGVAVKGGRFNYPSKTPLDTNLVQAALEALRSEGLEATWHYSRSALDAGFFTRHGVAAIQLGPGDETMAHTEFEMVSLEDVETAARVYVRILEAMTA